MARVQRLLGKAIALDPTLGAAHVLAGSLLVEQGESAKAIAAFEKAVEVSPQLADARYRLAQAYKRTGESAKAEEQLKIYSQLSKEADEREAREGREIQKFVYKLQAPGQARQ
jgi:cytochrome c-type biogenesis protein CcmH/NrfG